MSRPKKVSCPKCEGKGHIFVEIDINNCDNKAKEEICECPLCFGCGYLEESMKYKFLSRWIKKHNIIIY